MGHPGQRGPGALVQLRTGWPHKSTALVIYTGARIRPVITPDDPAQVAEVLTQHGVNNVTTGHEDGLL